MTTANLMDASAFVSNFVNYNMKKGWYLTSQPILTPTGTHLHPVEACGQCHSVAAWEES